MRLKYSTRNFDLVLEITGKFNVITGVSGSGKSDMAQLAFEFQQLTPTRAVKPRPIFSNARQDVTPHLLRVHSAVFVLDEGFDHEWVRLHIDEMRESDNYYIFISRDGIAELPYGIDNVFYLTGSHNHYIMVPRYSQAALTLKVAEDQSVITEDSGLGFAMVNSICSAGHSVLSAYGKDNLASKVKGTSGAPLVISDLCGIGKALDTLLLMQQRGECCLFDSLSFEQEILSSVFPSRYVPYDESVALTSESEESFYVEQLRQILSTHFGVSYDKGDTDLLALFESGAMKAHQGILRLSDAGGIPRSAYPTLRK